MPEQPVVHANVSVQEWQDEADAQTTIEPNDRGSRVHPPSIRTVKNRLKLASIATVVGISLILLGQCFSQAQAGTLTNVSVLLSNDLPFPHRSHFTILFTTATAGAIKTIDMAPTGGTGNEIVGASLVEVQGIGAGVSSVGGGAFTYTVNNAVNVPAGTTIKFVIADMPNLSPGSTGGVFSIWTKDAAGSILDSGYKQYAIRKIQAGEIAADAVTGAELAGVNNIKFGRCTIDPPSISDNSHKYIHVPACQLGLSGSAYVIAFPAGVGGTGEEGLHPRLVPKGSYAHCTPDCHLDVVVKNTARPPGSINDGPKVWVWIAWN